jgi:renalase
MKIAVIGAGLAGVCFAHGAIARGHTVNVFEKSRGTSGRLATRRSEHGAFDHGAPVIQAQSAAFRAQSEAWVAEGMLAKQGADFVAQPGMSSLVKALERACSANFHFEHRAIEFERSLHWSVSLATGADAAVNAGSDVPRTVFDGFDALVLAIPAEQAAAFQSPFMQQLQQIQSQPCIVLMASLPEPFSGVLPEGFKAFAESEKPGREHGHRYVFHASAAWSQAHVEDAADALRTKLCEALKIEPLWATAHKWRFSQASTLLNEACLFDEPQKLGLCGDYFLNPDLAATGELSSNSLGRAEHAWLSAQALLRHF